MLEQRPLLWIKWTNMKHQYLSQNAVLNLFIFKAKEGKGEYQSQAETNIDAIDKATLGLEHTKTIIYIKSMAFDGHREEI